MADVLFGAQSARLDQREQRRQFFRDRACADAERETGGKGAFQREGEAAALLNPDHRDGPARTDQPQGEVDGRIAADHFDRAIELAAPGILLDPLQRLVGVQRNRARCLGQRPAFRDRINRINHVRAHHEGAIDRHQPDRTQPDHRDARSGANVGIARAEPGRGQRVGHHQRLLHGDAVRHRHGVHVGGRHPHGFGLRALQLRRQAIATALPVFASVDHARQAGPALPAADRGGQHHLVTHFQPLNPAADLDHFAHRLVPDAEAGILGKAVAVVDVQVRSADRAGSDLDHRVPVGLRGGIVHRFIAHVARAVVPQGLHRRSFLNRSCSRRR